MTQVIVFTNDQGGVSVCSPSGDLPIEQVLGRDTPSTGIIIDSGDLPQGDDAQFSDAWELNEGVVAVNLAKAKTLHTDTLDNLAKNEAQHRLVNAAIGVDNKLVDKDWLALLTAARTALGKAASTTDLIAAVAPVRSAIEDNK